MGLAIDTNALSEYVLSADKGKPEAERPTLLFRYPSYRQFKQIARLMDEVRNEKDDDIYFGTVITATKLVLAGWRNFSIPYDPDQLDAVLSINDLIELRDKLLIALSVDEVDRKKLSSPSPSNSAASANAAVTATDENAASAQPKAA